MKIFKALNVMERHKQCEPLFSKAFGELGDYIIEKRKLNNSQQNLLNSGHKSQVSRLSIQDLSKIHPNDSIWNTKGFNDSVFTGKEQNL